MKENRQGCRLQPRLRPGAGSTPTPCFLRNSAATASSANTHLHLRSLVAPSAIKQPVEVLTLRALCPRMPDIGQTARKDRHRKQRYLGRYHPPSATEMILGHAGPCGVWRCFGRTSGDRFNHTTNRAK